MKTAHKTARKTAPITRRSWLAQTLVASGAAPALIGLNPARAASHFPSKPITLWVPWAAGGATDIVLRLLAELASPHLRQRVLVDNRGGAGGTLAMPILQNAEPDGHTIAQIPQPVLRAVHMQKVLWDPLRDITPVIQISGVTFGIVVPAHSEFRSVEDLFTFARAKPNTLTIATNGVGTTPHMVLDELFAARGLSYVHVPYKGTSEQMLAVDAGHVMLGVNSTGFAPFVESGRVRLLATFAARRSLRWPQVPTLKELGYKVVAMSPYGLGGPRGLQPAVVSKLHDAFRAAMYEPAFALELAKYDQVLDYLGPEEYGQSLRIEYAREKANVEKLGLARGGN